MNRRIFYSCVLALPSSWLLLVAHCLPAVAQQYRLLVQRLAHLRGVGKGVYSVWCSAVQCNAVQRSAVQCSAVQCSATTALPCTALCYAMLCMLFYSILFYSIRFYSKPHLPVERVDRDADLSSISVDVVAAEAVPQVGEKGGPAV